MIELDFIERLIRILDESGLDSLEVERGGTRVKLAKSPPAGVAPVSFAVPSGAVPAPPPSVDAPVVEPRTLAVASNLLEITAPMVGTFYLSPAPDAPAYVEPGTRVKPGDTLCIIEAMKLMTELECEISGTVAEVCVDNAQPVEFGQVLLRVDPG
jgi:acetyl-CoA carboxylase biotin carboxyl carrier protein